MVILIVDDIEINRKLLKVELEAEGYSTLLAEDGIEALKVLEKEKVDLIISDVLMPNMDGYLLCHKVRTNERLRNIPFIIYSSNCTSPGDIKLGEKLGADKYFNRPSPTKEILSAIQELIFPRYCGHTEGLGRIINLGGVKWKSVRGTGSTVGSSRRKQFV